MCVCGHVCEYVQEFVISYLCANMCKKHVKNEVVGLLLVVLPRGSQHACDAASVSSTPCVLCCCSCCSIPLQIQIPIDTATRWCHVPSTES